MNVVRLYYLWKYFNANNLCLLNYKNKCISSSYTYFYIHTMGLLGLCVFYLKEKEKSC